jgi:hypothetical protein
MERQNGIMINQRRLSTIPKIISGFIASFFICMPISFNKFAKSRIHHVLGFNPINENNQFLPLRGPAYPGMS